MNLGSMPKYKNILVATGFYLEYQQEVGVFTDNGNMVLIGQASIKKVKDKIYADIKTEHDLSEYYPEARNLGGVVDLIIFSRVPRQRHIKKVKEQMTT
jgi:hypothetical protein